MYQKIQKDAHEKNIWSVELLLISLSLLLIFRLISLYLSNTDLFFDEAQYWAWSRELDFGYFSKPPFLAWSIRATTEICGISNFCIRAASPVFHTLTAFFIFMAARSLYNQKTAIIAALAFITLPGISFSASLISTDVPLLTFWALSIWCFAEFLNKKSWFWAILMGFAIGLGLLSKYAMIFFILGITIYFIIAPNSREVVKNPKFWTAIGIASCILLPNILWNLNNGLVTFSHTADNANWTGSLLKPHKALEFFAAQFGVFGPVFFGALLVVVWRFFYYRKNKGSEFALTDKELLLLSLSVPIILTITVQAFLSRAHANWAATAYPAATILVVALMLKHKALIALRSSFAIHGLLLILLAIGTARAGHYAISKNIDPFSRVLGWEALSDKVKQKLEQEKFSAILTHSRDVSAEMVYYLRNQELPIYAWKPGKVPRNYYQMTSPYIPKKDSNDKILLVTKKKKPESILKNFQTVTYLGSETVSAGIVKKRTLHFYTLIE